ADFLVSDYGQLGNPLNPCGDPPAGVGGVQTVPSARGGALRAQSLRRPPGEPAVFGGSVIRVDPLTGTALPDSPLYGNPRPNADRLIAYGMRNPYRMTFRPGTRELWIGDVGEGFWEELNRVPDTLDSVIENFGWPCYEGPGLHIGYSDLQLEMCNTLFNSPGAVTYAHFSYRHLQPLFPGDQCSTDGSSISGLTFYAGGAYPAFYDNALFMADYSRNCIWSMRPGSDGLPDPTTLANFATGAAAPVDLQIGPDGDLFYADFNGTIRRIVSFSTNQPPIANVRADRTDGALPITVHFDASGSTDADAGDSLGFAWDLDGDGQYNDSSDPKPVFTYTTAATRTVRVRVTDSHGASATAALNITAGNTAPTVTITAPTAGTTWKVGQSIQFAGTVRDLEDGDQPIAVTWTILIYHCPLGCHTHPLQTFNGITSGSFAAPDHEYPSYLEIRLSAIDRGGLSSSTSIFLYPQTADVSFDSQPQGLALTVGTTTSTTPFVRKLIVNSTTAVIAASPQSAGAATYLFDSWSDHGEANHLLNVPAAPTSLQAVCRIQTGTPASTPTASAGIPPTPSRGTPIAGLMAAYSFDEGAGNVVHDSSGNGNDGVLMNPVSWSTNSKFGAGAASFSGGSASYVSVPDGPSFNAPDAVSLEAWIYPTTLDGSLRMVLGKEMIEPRYDTAWTLFGLGWDNQNKSAGSLVDGDTNAWFACSALQTVPLNQWTYLALTYDRASGDQILYLDGAQHRVCPQGSHPLKRSQQPLRIGGSSFSDFPFLGQIDEVRLWNYARSPQQIALDRDTPIGAPIPTPVATLTGTVTPSIASPTPTPLVAAAGAIHHVGNDAPVAGVTVDLLGSVNASAPSDSAGNFSVGSANAGNYVLRPHKLDVSGQGLSAIDASLVLQATVGLLTPDDALKLACDTNGSGTLTGLDASFILQKVVGMIDHLPVASRCGSDWMFVPRPAAAPNVTTVSPQVSPGSCQLGEIDYSPLAARVTDQSFSAIRFGDCSSDWTSASGSGAALVAANGATLRAGAPQVRGRRILIPLYVDGGQPFYAMELELRSDPLRARLQNVRPRGAARNALVVFNETPDGRSRIALASGLQMTAGTEPVLV
ncbi:MAG TPA: LamG-like jellyroll fold domain-containing protein, partial [Candidatus Acidoferrales bacterium]|nr:LamG-like jellyroll fold domain-containing protein [Candidatus Acidoferrales bacterium]